MRKKRVLFLTDYAGINTGFGKNIKLLLTYLSKNSDFELIQAACGLPKNNRDYEKFPWKTVGVLPESPESKARMQQDGNYARAASYGEDQIGAIVEEFKPDVVFSIQDSWGSLFVTDKPFFKKVPTVCWITFDSLPLLQDTIDKAKDITHYWSWSDFAELEFKKLGIDHVKTQYPLTNTDTFYPLKDSEKIEIRKKHGIDKDCKIFGFVFRNQLRKLVGTLIAGYAEFLRRNPENSNSKLLLHTHFGEGWEIMRFVEQYGVPKENILCTYICKESREYFILPYTGQDVENPKTKTKTLITANVQFGVSDVQLNEIYNLMDMYFHPATSGACEIPIVEAALTEKIVSTCDYSFGWNVVHKNKGCIPMEYSFYTEPPVSGNTQFLKSQPFPSSISKIMKKFVDMKEDRRREMEKSSRKWALENYAVQVNGQKIKDFIETIPLIEDENAWINKNDKSPNPSAYIDPELDNERWVVEMYHQILDAKDVDRNHTDVQHWMSQIEKGIPRQDIEKYFRNVASQDVSKSNQAKLTLECLFDPDDAKNNKKRLLLVQPQSAGDILLVTSLFESIRSKFPKESWTFYFACEPKFFELVEGNPYTDKIIPYNQIMDNQLAMEGSAQSDGFVDICLNPYFSTQRLLNYTHNGYSINQFDNKL